MSILNIQNWTSEQVSEWIGGLDSNLALYGAHFLSQRVNGKMLLNLMSGDLSRYGVSKVGDQMLLHDAIQSLRNEMESERVTLQWLASSLSVRCKTYRSELTRMSKKEGMISSTPQVKSYIPTESLGSASFLMDAAKVLIRWLARYPFSGTPDYDRITKQLTKHCFELAMLSQRDSFADNAIEEVQYLCTKIIEICDYIIFSRDSLVLLPAATDVVTLRKRNEQDWGLQFESNYFGIHQISGVTLSSPAQQSGHLERGDEILQVNYQTVVGWTQPNVISLLIENSNEAILTIKKRPRHAMNILGHVYLRPRIPNRKKSSITVTVSPIIENNVFPSSNSNSTDAEDSANSSDLSQPSEKLKEVGVVENASIEKEKNKSPVASSHAETRFWKLYPRPRNLIKRRATVTGASPTSTRPPVTFIDEETGTMHYKSRPPLDKSKSAPEKILKKQEKILEHSSGSNNATNPSYRITLPTSTLENFVLDENHVHIDPQVLRLKAASSHHSKEAKKEKHSSSNKHPESSCGKSSIMKTIVENHPSKNTFQSIIVKEQEVVTASTAVVKVQNKSPKCDTKSPCVEEKSLKGKDVESDDDVEPLHTGVLHMRQPQFRFGPRWTRFKTTLDGKRKFLQVGQLPSATHKVVLEGCAISLASEVHSRPFAFKVENNCDKSITYFAAESQNELETWMNLLTNGEAFANRNSRAPYKRSVSLGNSPRKFEFLRSSSGIFHSSSQINQNTSPNRRVSLPHSRTSITPLASSRNSRASLKNEWLQMKSQSTSKLNDPGSSDGSPQGKGYTPLSRHFTSSAKYGSQAERKYSPASAKRDAIANDSKKSVTTTKPEPSLPVESKIQSSSICPAEETCKGNPSCTKKPTPLPRTSLSRNTKECSGAHTMMGTGGGGPTTASKGCGSPLRRPNKDQQPTMGVSMLKHHGGSPTVLSPRRRRASSSSSDVFTYGEDAVSGTNGGRRLRCPSCGGSPIISIPSSTSVPTSFSDAGTQTEASVLLFFDGNGTESRV